MDYSDDGEKTRQRTFAATTHARLNALEADVKMTIDNGKAIAALEARLEQVEKVCGAGSDSQATVWNSTNGKLLIVGGVLVLLAVLGWNADDIAVIFARFSGG